MNELILQMDGAALVIRTTRTERDFVDFTLEVEFDGRVDARIPSREECRMHQVDMVGLARYVRSHVGADAPHDIGKSEVFVPREFDFTFQAREGWMASWREGYFTARWMIYCGARNRHDLNVYIGVDCVVQIPEVLRWCREIEAIAGALAS